LQRLPSIEQLRCRRLWSHEYECGQACIRPDLLRTTCHEAGLNFYMGASAPALQRPPSGSSGERQRDSRSPAIAPHAIRPRLVIQHHAPGHMPNPGNQPAALPHRHRQHARSYTRWQASAVLHTASAATALSAMAASACSSRSITQRQSKAAILTPLAPYRFRRHRLQFLPRGQLCRGRLRAYQHERGEHAFVPTTCNTCHESKA